VRASRHAEEGAGVVVGIDGTEASQDLLAFGFEHANVHRAPLRAVLCWHPDLLASMSWRAEPPPESVDAWLSDALVGLRERYPEVVVHPEVLREHPKSGLLKASEGQYLLVVGNRGRHAHVGTLLGSVSQRVLHHATCPVAVSRRTGPDRPDDCNDERSRHELDTERVHSPGRS
jgi:nucleotide-binding universal stress UspA family protein